MSHHQLVSSQLCVDLLTSEDKKIAMLTPVIIKSMGCAGRPQKHIDPSYLCEATANNRQIKLTELACTLGVHRVTLYHQMKQHGVIWQYSALSNQDLDNLTKIFKAQKPNSGLRYLIGFLHAHGFRVQRRCVVYSLRQVDALGTRLRDRKAIKRKQY
jgi:hypothetical protein